MQTGKLIITRIESLEPIHKKFGPHDEFERFEVIPKLQSNKCRVYFYRIPPGKANFPYHYHDLNEEVFYIISGRGIVITEEGKKNIFAGDVIVCPANPHGAHKIANTSTTEVLTYIEFDTAFYPDIANYPETNTFGVSRGDSNYEFFRKSTNIDYANEVETSRKDW